MNRVYGVVAGIDVHKRMLAVVVAVLGEQKIEYQQRKFGTSYGELEELTKWLGEQQVSEIAMESTAQYWRPVWLALEGRFRLHLAQPRSTRAPRGRKSDFADATRIVRRLLAEDLTLCAGSGATAMAGDDTHAGADEHPASAPPQSDGRVAGGGPDQAV